MVGAIYPHSCEKITHLYHEVGKSQWYFKNRECLCGAMLFKVGLHNGWRVSLLDAYKETGLNKSLQKLADGQGPCSKSELFPIDTGSL